MTDGPDGIHTATLADIYARQGHVERAIEIYRELVDAHPDDPQLRERLAALAARAAEVGTASARERKVARLRTLLGRVRTRRLRS